MGLKVSQNVLNTYFLLNLFPMFLLREGSAKRKAFKTSKSAIFLENSGTENEFLRLNGVENVSNISQSVRNIIMNDQKHILDFCKSHKGLLQKVSGTHPLKKKFPFYQLSFKSLFNFCKFNITW